MADTSHVTPGQRWRATELLRLARDEFGQLREPDRRVIRAAALGEIASFEPEDGQYTQALAAAIKAEQRATQNGEAQPPADDRPVPKTKVRAAVIRWLLTDRAALESVAPEGVQIAGAHLPETLNLQECALERPIQLSFCVLARGMVLLGATTRGINMHGTTVRPNHNGKAVVADGVVVKGDLFLRKGFRAEGEVRLLGATIEGDLECTDGRFSNKNGNAISADGIVVHGTCLLRRADVAAGSIDLTRGRIGYLVDNEPWPKEIILADCRYDAIFAGSPLDAKRRLKWLATHDRTVEPLSKNTPLDPQPYRWLAEVMRRQGYEDDAGKVLRELGWRRWQRSLALRFKRVRVWMLRKLGWRGRLLWRRVWRGMTWLFRYAMRPLSWCIEVLATPLRFLRNLLFGLRELLSGLGELMSGLVSGLLIGHGYARWRPLGWATLMVVVGAFVFSSGDKGDMQPAQALALRDWTQAQENGSVQTPDGSAWIRSYPKFNRWIYSADTFLPLVSFHQEDHWTPAGGPRWSRGWIVKNLYLPFHIAAGWVLATLFAASFTRLMRHEQ